jgi:Transglycosylase SLT domain
MTHRADELHTRGTTLGVVHLGAARSAEATGTILWAWYYRRGMLVEPGRMAAGVQAMKQALVDNGFGDGVVVDLPAWGSAAQRETKRFQAEEGLQADGVIGRVTARHLFRVYDAATEDKYGIPDELVGRQSHAESDNDPVARSSTGDEGRGQINPPSHPQVTLAQMWTPAFASNFTGSYLHGSYIYVGGDWDGAIAAYNVGGQLAKEWVAAERRPDDRPRRRRGRRLDALHRLRRRRPRDELLAETTPGADTSTVAKETYDGPICYVGQDQETIDGRRVEGGWHYTVAKVHVSIGTDAKGNEIVAEGEAPGEKLWMSQDGKTIRLAKDGDQSWHERHHERYNVIAPGGNIGDPHNADAVEATEQHLDRLEKRLAESGLDPHEADHIYTRPDQIENARRWLATHPNRSVR